MGETIYTCKYCRKHFNTSGKLFSGESSLHLHELKCRYNPDNYSKYQDKISDLEYELNDDGRLFAKWKMKCCNAEKEGLHCNLTFHEFCLLVKDANLVSSQLGFSGDMYVLARYEDKGDYTFNNCRFITQKENSDEKVITEKVRESGRRNVQKMIEHNRNDPNFGKKISERLRNSDYYKEKCRLSAEKEANRRSRLDPRWSGEHNSQLGTHWITNGFENKKWHPDKELEIPEGWRLGRIMKSST